MILINKIIKMSYQARDFGYKNKINLCPLYSFRLLMVGLSFLCHSASSIFRYASPRLLKSSSFTSSSSIVVRHAAKWVLIGPALFLCSPRRRRMCRGSVPHIGRFTSTTSQMIYDAATDHLRNRLFNGG